MLHCLVEATAISRGSSNPGTTNASISSLDPTIMIMLSNHCPDSLTTKIFQGAILSSLVKQPGSTTRRSLLTTVKESMRRTIRPFLLI